MVVDDLDHRISVFDSSGERVRVLGGHGSRPGQLLWPDALHWDTDGLLYIADTGANRVQVWRENGEFVREFGRASRGWKIGRLAAYAAAASCLAGGIWLVFRPDRRQTRGGRAASGLLALSASLACAWYAVASYGELRNPRDVWVTPEGLVFVTDFGSHTVRVYGTNGAFVRTIGTRGAGAGELDHPVGVVSSGGLVYVSDSGNHRIQVFTTAGSFIRQIGRFGSGEGELKSPHGIALKDRLYISDRGNHRVQVLTFDGAVVASLGADEAGAGGRPFLPAGLCVRDDGTVLIVDTGGRRIVQWAVR
jgi:DNA-binding beta-propeller fold protein YncE